MRSRQWKNQVRALALLTPLFVCASAGAQARAAANAEAAAATSASVANAPLGQAIWKQLVADRHLDATGVVVTERKGIVELSGAVAVGLWRERAARIAALVGGVRGVVNRLRVVPVRRPDRMLTREVRSKLRATAALAPLPIQARARDGVVELSGFITSWEQQQLAERIARAVPGVRFCQNLLTASVSLGRTPAMLAGDVKSRLDWDPWLQGQGIEVAVSGTTVQLRGQVASAARQRRAIRHAWVKGVTAVDARDLTVSPHSAARDHFRETRPSDEEIRAAITDLAEYFPQVPLSALKLSIVSGVVTLQGTVPTLASKRAAEELARSAAGVGQLRSDLRGPWWRAPARTAPKPPRATKRRSRR